MDVTEQPSVYRLAEVKAALGVSETAARGWLAAYEAATGELLPREAGGKSNAARLVPHDALEAIKRAREVSAANPGRITAEDALRRALGLEVRPLRPHAEGLDAAAAMNLLQALSEEIAATRDAVGRLERQLAVQVAENARLLAALPSLMAGSGVNAIREDVQAEVRPVREEIARVHAELEVMSGQLVPTAFQMLHEQQAATGEAVERLEAENQALRAEVAELVAASRTTMKEEVAPLREAIEQAHVTSDIWTNVVVNLERENAMLRTKVEGEQAAKRPWFVRLLSGVLNFRRVK